MRVLFAVDGSDSAFEAVRQVGGLLRPERDDVAFYCRPPQFDVRSAEVSKELIAEAGGQFVDALLYEAQNRLATNFAKKADIILGHQDPRHGIVVAGRQWSAELIVVGARGLNPFRRLLLGSVSRAVVHESDIPVWVNRQATEKAEAGMKILVASESPQAIQRPATILAELNWLADARFKVISVISSILGGSIPDWLSHQYRSPETQQLIQAWVAEHEAEAQTTLQSMQEAVCQLPSPVYGADVLVGEGEPAQVILDTAAKTASRLIVIGSRQKWTRGSAIFGRVSEAVLNHATCSVLVVPHLEKP